MKRVVLPPGCTGIDLPGGGRYTADRHGQVQVSDRHADVIRKSWYQESGVIVATERHHIGTRTGRWCTTCQPARLWNSWNTDCPRCGSATTVSEEQQ